MNDEREIVERAIGLGAGGGTVSMNRQQIPSGGSFQQKPYIVVGGSAYGPYATVAAANNALAQYHAAYIKYFTPNNPPKAQ